ncbi:DUF2520 domain-containing protein [Sphingobium sp. BYY-5]|uniref:Rossmann-like and DUF2520 domain-containing protein n=1 Tax=Sphingobium sp. BYY-5 TaxID=2926400 RepID=UPI001FA7357A|nr:Rossmann-like and DUF2520 domain-containing protein [Sphingobium sp. BYY-5]MCI4592014.1 DUF2520 domain-containing protein [Sphingobium sp. BYY-5]
MSSNQPYHRIGIVGTGRVASAMALGLQSYSTRPAMLWGRNTTTLEVAADRIGDVAATTDLRTIIASCDLIAIAVADDAIAQIVADMARFSPRDDRPFIFHVSGRSGATLLDPLRDRGALTAAIHPVMTFTGNPRTEVARMIGAHFAITGSSKQASLEAARLVQLLGGIPTPIAEEHRAVYHAGLCHAANHLVTLIDGACQALTMAGVGDPHALLAPLVRATLDNSLEKGFAALSGPMLRGDGETIANHLAALAKDCPQLLPAYRAMAMATLDRLEQPGDQSLSAIRQILG